MPPLDPSHFLQTFNVSNPADKNLLDGTFTKYYKPDAVKLANYIAGTPEPTVKKSSVKVPEKNRKVAVSRIGKDTLTGGNVLHLVDTRMRANADGVVSKIKIWSRQQQCLESCSLPDGRFR